MQKRSWVRPLAAGLLVSLVGVVAVACGGGGGGSSTSSGSASGSGGSARAIDSAKPGTGYAEPAVAPQGQASTAVTVPMPTVAAEGPKVIRSGQVAIEVKTGRFDSTYSSLIALAGDEGGVVASSTAATDGDRIRTGTVTLSVPIDHFQATIDRLRQMGTVQQLNVSSQDVSQQYVDLQARLANAEAERDAMLALLQKAQTVQDILAVQSQLGNYTQQVEQLKGQIGYLDHATSYSTIQVTIREAGVAPPKPPVDEWGISTAVWNGLHALVQTVNGAIVVLIVVGPYVLIALAGWLLWRRRRRMASV